MSDLESLNVARDAEVAAALAEAGLPPEASVADLIRHHRNNAAFAVAFEQEAERGRFLADLERHLDAISGEDGVLADHGECVICVWRFQ